MLPPHANMEPQLLRLFPTIHDEHFDIFEGRRSTLYIINTRQMQITVKENKGRKHTAITLQADRVKTINLLLQQLQIAH